jgi:hypothetical protein
MTERTARIGYCHEYTAEGQRLPGDDKMSIGQMIDLSAREPYNKTYHCYNFQGCIVWAHAGQEISAPPFAQPDTTP